MLYFGSALFGSLNLLRAERTKSQPKKVSNESLFFRSVVHFVCTHSHFLLKRKKFVLVRSPSKSMFLLLLLRHVEYFFYYFIMLLQNVHTNRRSIISYIFFVFFFFIIECLCSANCTHTRFENVFVLIRWWLHRSQMYT